MAEYAGQIEDQQYPYIATSWPYSATPTINSTSLIASVLWSVGIDLNNLMPFTLRLSPGPETLLGTFSADDMTAENNYTTVATGPGDDTLRGSTNTQWVEKLYGGAGDDTFIWSYGENILHGGQPRMPYASDGTDTVDYSGVGAVHIVANTYAVEHKVADYIAVFEGGSDQWFSIEQVAWDRSNDIITAGPGVDILEKPLGLDLKDESGSIGDKFELSETSTPLLINAVNATMISVQAQHNEGLDAGYWVNSVEWITASNGDDRIYAGPGLRGVEGAGGDDLIDARLSAAFSAQSPLGYDIEIDGGDGDDILVSGSGRTFARGGGGADQFVLSAMTSGDGTVEFVIDDADFSDTLFIPYDLFTASRGTFEASPLFQLTGGVFKIDASIDPSYFYWGPPDDNQVQGNIEFVGSIAYTKDGSDLVITLLQGHVETDVIDNGPGEPPGPTITGVVVEPETETTIRVTDWSDGILGLTFPLTFDFPTFASAGGLANYPGLQSAIDAATSPDKFIAPMDARPDGYLPKELGTASVIAARMLAAPITDGTDDDDVIVADVGGPYHIFGRGGDDTITGSDGGDVIDGGAGRDVMAGGRGNDVYYVDNPGDVIIETDRGGFDKVISSIDYSLGAFLEHVTLTGSAISATGNALRNTLEGNALNNILSGGDGNDTFAGNGGDDILIGGNGSDGYVYELGDGRDTIIETGTGPDDRDVIVLAGAMTPEDVTFIRNPDVLDDLILQFPDGGSITIKDYFATTGPNIEGVEFASGTVWSRVDLAARAATAILTRNTAPIARDDSYGFSGGRAVTIPVAALLDNDSDSDGDTLHVTQLFNILGGTAVLDGLGGVVITRTDTTQDIVSFDYAITDGNGGAARASFSIALPDQAATNQAPEILSSTLAPVIEDRESAGYITATDPDGDTLIFALKDGAGPSKGSVTFGSGGHFTYTPAANVHGPDAFTITVADGVNAPVESHFSFAIAPVNDAPIAKADSGFTVRAGHTLNIAASSLLQNDRDIDGDALSIASISSVNGGKAVLTPDGTISFKAHAPGPASFTYTVTDGNGGTASAVVDVAVTLPPTANTHALNGAHAGRNVHSASANDVFIGNAGNDTFVFRAHSGHDPMSNYQVGTHLTTIREILDENAKTFAGYDERIYSFHRSLHDVVSADDDGGPVRVKGFNVHALQFDAFNVI